MKSTHPIYTASVYLEVDDTGLPKRSPRTDADAHIKSLFAFGRRERGAEQRKRLGIRCFKIGGLKRTKEEYAHLISDYFSLPSAARSTMEECADETFSLDECISLWDFLLARGVWNGSFAIDKSYYPLVYTSDPEVGRVTKSFRQSQRNPSPGAEFIDFSELSGYDLPFDAGGFFYKTGLPDQFSLPW